MDQMIFKYTLYDAWYKMYLSLQVLDKKKNNLICMEGENKIISTINDNLIKEIKNIINSYNKLSEIKCTDFAPILDGSWNVFEIAFDNKIYKIKGDNLWWFLDDENIESFKKNKDYYPSKSILILQFHKNLRIYYQKMILIQNI